MYQLGIDVVSFFLGGAALSKVGMITFGISAPIKKVQTELGMTVEAVVAAARPPNH